jgi:hypothetical protein
MAIQNLTHNILEPKGLRNLKVRLWTTIQSILGSIPSQICVCVIWG